MSKKKIEEKIDEEVETEDDKKTEDEVEAEKAEENGEVTEEAQKTEDEAEAEDESEGDEENGKPHRKLALDILSCVIAVAAIVVAMIFVIKSKETDTVTHLEEKAPYIYEAGNIDCWYDTAKDKYYSDKKCKNEIDKDTVFIYYFDKNVTGVVKAGIKYYYVGGGVADKSFTNFAADENGNWYYFENGINNEHADDVVKGTVNGEEAWWCIKNGQVAFIDTIAENVNGYWAIKGGKVVFQDMIATNEEGSWYCKGGKLDYDFTGQVELDNKTYVIENGKVVKVK